MEELCSYTRVEYPERSHNITLSSNIKLTRLQGRVFWDPCIIGADFWTPCIFGEDFWDTLYIWSRVLPAACYMTTQGPNHHLHDLIFWFIFPTTTYCQNYKLPKVYNLVFTLEVSGICKEFAKIIMIMTNLVALKNYCITPLGEV